MHISGSDRLTPKISQFGSVASVITWREILSEGRTLHEVGSEQFWKERFLFLQSSYAWSKQRFVQRTLREYRNLCRAKSQDIIALWFDTDLSSQINLIAILSWLKTHRRYAQIFWVDVSISDIDLADQWTDQQISDAWAHRKELSQDDIEFADYAWQIYCSDNPIRLTQISHSNQTQLSALPQNISVHLKRFPAVFNGLSEFENTLLQKLATHGTSDVDSFIDELYRTQLRTYGYNKLQIKRVFQKLSPWINSSTHEVKTMGKKILNGQANAYSLLKDQGYLGGALTYDYLWDAQAGRILKL
ncbi:MAG: hypothetical protein RLZZ463_936 [Bacteroidota bacterium]